MNNKIQGIITAIYDWLDANPAFKVITQASHFCSTDKFLSCAAELHSLLTQARILLNEFSEHIEKINLCLLKLNEEISRDVSKKRITEEELKLLLKDNNIQVTITDLLIVAKRLRRLVRSKDIAKHINDGRLLEDTETISDLILAKYEHLDVEINRSKKREVFYE